MRLTAASLALVGAVGGFATPVRVAAQATLAPATKVAPGSPEAGFAPTAYAKDNHDFQAEAREMDAAQFKLADIAEQKASTEGASFCQAGASQLQRGTVQPKRHEQRSGRPTRRDRGADARAPNPCRPIAGEHGRGPLVCRLRGPAPERSAGPGRTLRCWRHGWAMASVRHRSRVGRPHPARNRAQLAETVSGPGKPGSSGRRDSGNGRPRPG